MDKKYFFFFIFLRLFRVLDQLDVQYGCQQHFFWHSVLLTPFTQSACVLLSAFSFSYTFFLAHSMSLKDHSLLCWPFFRLLFFARSVCYSKYLLGLLLIIYLPQPFISLRQNFIIWMLFKLQYQAFRLNYMTLHIDYQQQTQQVKQSLQKNIFEIRTEIKFLCILALVLVFILVLSS